jgi:ATP phosphoribosyltransferase regulatory subunit
MQPIPQPQSDLATARHWQLPEGIESALPPEAARLEMARRRLLDLFQAWGYELVMPPIVDHLESLLTGVGNDLEQMTFKLVDPAGGRLLGVRADMTPQVARMDAHQLSHDGPSRLCYLGSVLTVQRDGLSGSRNPLQVGAELYGHGGVESDLEVLSLLVDALAVAGVRAPCIDLGHMGVFNAAVATLGLAAEQQGELFQRLQRKALPELLAQAVDWPQAERAQGWLHAWVGLNGGREVLTAAREAFADLGPGMRAALDDLDHLVTGLNERHPEVSVHIDLAELRGYHYHTGVIFTAYAEGWGHSLARGGRYDDIGRFFGRARPATGFSLDLKALTSGFALPSAPLPIAAPACNDAALAQAIRQLRAAGEVVVQLLPGPGGDAEADYRRRLVETASGWTVVAS